MLLAMLRYIYSDYLEYIYVHHVLIGCPHLTAIGLDILLRYSIVRRCVH